jgi:membrane fusion protein, multidrug efflux system
MSEVSATRRNFIGGLLVVGIVAAAIAYTAYYLLHTVQKDARLAGLPIPVQTVPTSVKLLHETIGASGTIQNSVPATLTAKVVSRVLKVPVGLGVVVRAGDLLVQMDPSLLEANLETARTNYDHAKHQLQRMMDLLRKNYGAAVDVEEARTAEAAGRDAVIRAEIDLSNTRVVSPVPGVVLERQINPGEVTKLQQELIRLGVLDPVMMVAQVAEDKIDEVYLGMKGIVATDAFPGVNFTGAVGGFKIFSWSRCFCGFWLRRTRSGVCIYPAPSKKSTR